MKYLDKNKNEIEDGNSLLFSLEDSVEPTGFNKYVTPVKLCFYSEVEKRYIPFDENWNIGNVFEAEIVKNVKP